jgi:probable phosphoglycerate mutase
MELYLIRHGLTVWNAAGRLQGNADIELNEQGREAAAKLGNELEDTEFDVIYSSPRIRAFETACLIRGRRNIQIIRDERLRELSFGDMEGAFYTDWNSPESPYRFFFTEPDKYAPPPNGESLEELCSRTKDFIQSVLEKDFEKRKRVMVVAHGALNKGLMCYLEGNDKAHFWGKGLQKNCQASIFDFDGKNWKKLTSD